MTPWMNSTDDEDGRHMGLCKIKNHLYNLPALCVVLLLQGCLMTDGDTLGDLRSYVQTQKEKRWGVIEPLPMLMPYLRFEYPNLGIDPFDESRTVDNSVRKEKVKDTGVKVDFNRTPEVLEGFDLETLVMTGTVKKNGVLWALIRLPNNNVVRVRKGNYMGLNYGKITAITELGIELKETVDNGNGGYKHRNNVLMFSLAGSEE